MPYGNDNYFKEKDRLRLGAFTLHNRHNTVALGGLEMVGRRSVRRLRCAFGVKRQPHRRILCVRTGTWLLHNHRRRAARHRLCYPVTQKGKSRCYRRRDSGASMPTLQAHVARDNVQVAIKSHGIPRGPNTFETKMRQMREIYSPKNKRNTPSLGA